LGYWKIFVLITSIFAIGLLVPSADAASPKVLDQLITEGIKLANAGHYDDALEKFEEVLELDPTRTELLIDIAEMHFLLEKYDEAIIYYDKAHVHFPNDPLILQYKGLSLKQLDRIGEALIYFDAALVINPTEPSLLYDIGMVYYEHGEFETALDYFERSLQYDPTLARVQKGLTLIALGNPEQSLFLFESTDFTSKQRTQAFYGKASAAFHQGNYVDAVVFVQRAEDRSENYLDPLYLKGRIFHDMGQYKKAIKNYDLALKIDPEYAPALKNKDLAQQEVKSQNFEFEQFPIEKVTITGNLNQQSQITDEATNDIPQWIKNNAEWWSKNQIEDSDFILGLEFLIKQGVITVSATDQSQQSENIPEWVRNTAGWWSEGQISDDDFIQSIQWLINNGFIRI